MKTYHSFQVLPAALLGIFLLFLGHGGVQAQKAPPPPSEAAETATLDEKERAAEGEAATGDKDRQPNPESADEAAAARARATQHPPGEKKTDPAKNTPRFTVRDDFDRPRYLNDGRRYVHYNSRSSIPAILMAAQAMNYVQFQPAREVAPIFYERREVSSAEAVPLPPESYRDEDALVLSYPVDEKSMITSGDILFQQGSTQFADPYSYDIVSTLADAMKDLPAKSLPTLSHTAGRCSRGTGFFTA